MFRRKTQKMLAAGANAPSFQLHTVDGETVGLKDLVAKGPALLAFFKVSCPVCQLTFPYLQKFAAQAHGLQVVGICQDGAPQASAFNKRFGVEFPTLLDEDAAGYPASNSYGITSVPSLFVVEADGVVSKAFNGFSKNDLEELGKRVGVNPFAGGESVPQFKPG